MVDHVAEDCAYSIETLISLADVLQSKVVQKNLLHNKNGNSLAQLAAGLHDAKAKRNNLGGQEEVDDLAAVVLDKGADDAERSEAEILERTRLRRRVQEWV